VGGFGGHIIIKYEKAKIKDYVAHHNVGQNAGDPRVKNKVIICGSILLFIRSSFYVF
jgi:hypothetical protein